ncbi:MAG: Ycf66 family protein [Coleofasciculus sp. B1-GNL1-01]|uniref:Ycf66 family protein n=1 Tax=Coleofasciculus sp. B1-GNL1-01 TaxID=3068484 RepID=UPI0032F3350A
MVNFGLNSASILGIFLAVAGAGLYFLRSVRPELARDHDIFFAAVGLLCGFILVFQGWRLDPILQFGQFLLTGSVIFFAVETLRLRGITTEQAKRNTKVVDDERPVSNVYRQVAELDELEPIEEEDPYIGRRLRGTADSRYSRSDRYEAEDRRPRSRSVYDDFPPEERTRQRRSRPVTRSSRPPADRWEADVDNDWDDRPTPPSRRSRPSRPSSRNPEPDPDYPPRRKRRPPQASTVSVADQEVEPPANDYVDYKPIDPLEDEDEDDYMPRGSEY